MTSNRIIELDIESHVSVISQKKKKILSFRISYLRI